MDEDYRWNFKHIYFSLSLSLSLSKRVVIQRTQKLYMRNPSKEKQQLKSTRIQPKFSPSFHETLGVSSDET